MTSAVSFQNVSRHFGNVKAVDDVTLTIAPGEFFAMLGPSGSGKTTSIGKLAARYKRMGKSVLLVAADTYRAAAIDQLEIWAERVGVPIITSQQGSDPGAVTYDGIKSAVSRGIDVVLIDTAGRLHTRYNLMEEIKKVYRVAEKALPGAPHHSWIVLDTTTGHGFCH